MTRKNYTKDGQGKGIVAPVQEENKLIIPGRTGLLVEADADEFDEEPRRRGPQTLFPRIAILEGLSPQIKPRAAEYIPNARIGQFCDTTFGDVWDELYFVPLEYVDIYIEWAPRNTGEGLVAYYGPDPTEYNKVQPAPGEFKHIRPNGNEIVQHGTIYMFNLSASNRICFFPMSSTRHRQAEMFEALTQEVKGVNPKTGLEEPLAMCSYIYQATVGEKTKGDNSWHLPLFKRTEYKTKRHDPRLYENAKEAAKEIRKHVKRGDVRNDFARDDEETTPRANAPM